MRVLKVLSTFLAALTLVAAADAQSVREHELGARAFAFHSGVARKITSQEGSADARQIVQTVMSKIGLPMNLDVRAAPGIRNAEALVDEIAGKQVRVILYDPKWMEDLKSTLETNWSDISILAHEIGHHLAGHLDPAYANHPAELEADRFSGFILNRMGATLEQAQLAMAMISSETASDSHPARAQRVRSISSGWKDAAGGQGANVIKSSLSEQDRTGVVAKSPAPGQDNRNVAPGARVALLIGNSDYRHLPRLANPKNDVLAVQRELRKLGFLTTTLYDATKQQISDAVPLFREFAKDADWALFYFSGQGTEVDGINYVAPVDAKVDGRPTQGQLDASLFRLDAAFEAVKEAKTLRLVVTDACRDDPFGVVRASGPHIFKVAEPPPGIVVAYSTRAGEVALDGMGDLSPYAEAFVKALSEPGIEIDKVFRRVNAEVPKLTQGQQQPTVLGNWPAQDLYLARR